MLLIKLEGYMLVEKKERVFMVFHTNVSKFSNERAVLSLVHTSDIITERKVQFFPYVATMSLCHIVHTADIKHQYEFSFEFA